MSRLPTPGQDDGTWGAVLNDFLSVVHKPTGELVDGSVTTAALANAAITSPKLDAATQNSLAKANTALQSVTKSDVGLANVDNTSDLSKPVSTATTSALTGKANVTHTHVTADITDLQTTLDAKAPLASPAFTGTPTGITKNHVGLANVDNTSDLSKPVSNATQTALDAKLATNNLDSATAALVGTSSATATAITSKISAATAGTTNVYVLAASDPDPTAGSPAGLYFRRSS